MKTLEDVLEEIAPVPDPDFVADMEWRMRRGFPQPERKPRFPRIALPALRPRALAAVAASALLALLVTVSLLGGGSQPSREDTVAVLPDEPAIETTELQGHGVPPDTAGGGGARRAIADDGAAISVSPPIPGHEDVAPRAPNRRIERSAQLTLASDPDEFDDLADSIFRTADRRRGFVLRSSFTQGESGAAGGFFELRVPSAQLQATLNELSRLATVRARSESGNDVTAGFVSLRDRLRTAQAERKSLLRRLELAVTETAAGALRRRLAIIGRRISRVGTQIRGARERTEFATVIVELVDQDAGPAAGKSETGEALDDAVGMLEGILSFLIRALGVLLPVAVVGLLVWAGAAYARRRARERALA